MGGVVKEQLRLALGPVGVVGHGVDAGDALVARLSAAAGSKVGALLVGRAVVGPRRRQLAAGRGIKRRLPVTAASPWRRATLGVDGEVVDRS
jgi:NAD(P)H-hydrate repair Nnr-like enzyme with NAD(P)H-hydrate epimerase domain